MPKFRFNRIYFLLFSVIFAAEIGIAIFINDTIIRPFVGDVLVVILIYCFVRIFLNADYFKIASGVFLFACLIEVLQFFDFVKIIGFENNRFVSVVLGRTFAAEDFAAYFGGFLLILFFEKLRQNNAL